MFDTHVISNLCGFASIGCWLGAQLPQAIENIRRQSCEGLALPFLANWLLGDVSNLLGCILTHQLPFQRYLATYFVMVDCVLFIQYFYYYKPPKALPPMHAHARSATMPPGRRLSVDRGATRYRTLSAVVSNVAAAAARQDELGEVHQPSPYPRRRSRIRHIASDDGREQEEREELQSTMVESFYSEGGRDVRPRRVSWSIDRQRSRAASVGRSVREPPGLTLLPNDPLLSSQSENVRHEVPFSQSSHNVPASSTESLTPTFVSARGTRAGRRGSTMVFLGAWALFGLGALTHKQGIPYSDNRPSIGRVLATVEYRNGPVPIASENARIYQRDSGTRNLDTVDLTFSGQSDIPEGPSHDDHEPSPEQVFGRFFAWLCTTLYITSRLPQIWKNFVRKSVEGLSMYLFVFAFLGNTFYVASILLNPRRFLPPSQATKYIQESIPYLLGSAGTLMFDVTIVSQSFCYRPRHRRHVASTYVRVFDDEEAGLLSGDVLDAQHAADSSSIVNRGRTSHAQTSAI